MMYLVKGKDEKEKARLIPTESTPAILEKKLEALGLTIVWRDEIHYPGPATNFPARRRWEEAMKKICGDRRRGVNSGRTLLENVYLAGRLAER